MAKCCARVLRTASYPASLAGVSHSVSVVLSLKRIDQRIRYQYRVVHAVFLGKFELPCLAHEAVEIAPHVEHTRQIIDACLKDRIVGLNRDPFRALSPSR